MKSETPSRNPPAAGLQIYLKDIDETALLSAQEERDLAGRIAEGDTAARDRLVRANLRLVVRIARGSLGRGLSLEDLISEGNLGLMRTVEGFDPALEVRFSTYASHWIKQSMRRAVMNQGQLVRVPAYLHALIPRWWRATAVLSERLGREPTPGEVGKALGLSRKQLGVVTQAIQVKKQLNSLEPSPEAEDGLDQVADGRIRDAGDPLVEADDLAWIHRGLGRLDDLKAEVIGMRFGIGPHAPMTLQEVGSQLGLTRHAVRQLENEALEQLLAAARLERPSDSRPGRPLWFQPAGSFRR